MSNIIQPSYIVKQPSTSKSIKFRPFTVREERALLLALQEDNLETVALAIRNTIFTCTDGVIDADNIPHYDAEFIYLHIRAKSVGETIDLVGGCECSDEVEVPFSVDIMSTYVEPKPDHSGIFKVPGTIYTIKLRHPSLTDYGSALTDTNKSGSATVVNCILSVYSDDEVFDWSFDEKFDFVESMTPIQQRDIIRFLESAPMTKLDAKYKCNRCGTEHKSVLSGFNNFFV